MRKNQINILFACMLLAVVTLSCDNSTWYSENYRLENEKWSMYDPAKYACTIEDTVRTYDIEFSLRTSTDYPYRNMYLFIVTSFPSGTTVTDTLNAMVADEKGRWMGKGAGDLRELTIPYKANVYFPEKGEYHFRVIHGMRDTVLKGVYDMGMKVSLRESKQK
ncbi:MAG: gliding motility lipoprotein GldH [Bacteroidales bacterium]|nr:gliding motility lipoprotein GldH [Bacteroidales bacterium]